MCETGGRCKTDFWAASSIATSLLVYNISCNLLFFHFTKAVTNKVRVIEKLSFSSFFIEYVYIFYDYETYGYLEKWKFVESIATLLGGKVVTNLLLES